MVKNSRKLEKKKFISNRFSKKLNSSVSVISRYERNKMTPSIDTAKKLVNLLETSVDYLLGANEQAYLFKNPNMLNRFKDILFFL